MAQVRGAKKKKSPTVAELNRLKKELKGVTERLEARQRSEIYDVAKDKPAARMGLGESRLLTAHIRRSL